MLGWCECVYTGRFSVCDGLQLDRLGSEVLWRDAQPMLKELQSSWRILQVTFQRRFPIWHPQIVLL